MKKILGILFLICLVTPFIGSYTWFRHHTRQVRREVRRRITEGMEKDELTELSFAKNQAGSLLRWEEPGEFEYRGKMYDVVKQEEQGDSITYLCYQDDEETELKHQVKQVVIRLFGKTLQKSEQCSHLAHFFTNLFHSEIPRWRSFVDSNGSFGYNIVNTSYRSLTFAPVAPPPRIL